MNKIEIDSRKLIFTLYIFNLELPLMVWLLASSSLKLRPLRTFLTALGIAVAVASMVIFLSLGEGLRKAFSEELGSIGPDLQVSYGPFDATASLSSLPELPLSYKTELEQNATQYGITKVTPLLFHLRSGFSTTSAFIFQGVPPEEDISSIYYDFEIVEGRALSRSDTNANVAIIGEQVARRNRLAINDDR